MPPPANTIDILSTAYITQPVFILNIIAAVLALNTIVSSRFLIWKVQDRGVGLMSFLFTLPLVLACDFLAFLIVPFLVMSLDIGANPQQAIPTISTTVQTVIGYTLPIISLLLNGGNAYLLKKKISFNSSLGIRLLVFFALMTTVTFVGGFAWFFEVATAELASDPAQVEEFSRTTGAALFPILIVSYSAMILFTIIVTYRTTVPLRTLADFTRRAADGKYEFAPVLEGGIHDEVTRLTQDFNVMIGKVNQREETLKTEVAELRIIIDEQKRQEDVEEITGSDFFQDLQSRAKQMRDDYQQGYQQDAQDGE